MDKSEDFVAIIGMACRFPGAKNYHQFWDNLEKGINSITEIPSNRWNIETFYSSNPDKTNKSISKSGGFIEDADKFDPRFFGISPREARLLDPQQRLMLELSWSCLEDSGYSPTELAGTNVGVFVGVVNFDYKELLEKYHNIEGHTSTGTYTSIIPNRISYFFNFHGLSVPVDTACSSSLVAIHQAINALKENECAMALVGGVNVLCSPTYYISFSKLGMLSPQGQCKTFDAKADGYVRGEGAGVILLKPLKNAIKDKDYIYGVIRGSAVNHGGAARTLTSPNVYAQSQVIQAAYTKANIPPNTVSYIEAHGTGTPLGDPIEINGLKRAFTQLYQQYGMDAANEPHCGISTVKTNIGHLESAAGIAGIIKVLLAMKHKKLPKITNYQHLNPRIKLDGSPFYIVEETKYWEQLRTKEGDIIPRRAGVSSFGFGGVNAHVVLEEAPALESRSAEVERNHHLLTISAKCEEALLGLAQRYEDFFATHPESSLADVCFTANTGRSHFEYRLAVVAESNLQLRDELTAFATGKETFRLISGRVNSTKPPKIAFLFTGQGSQYINMGRQLYELSPTFRQTLDRCDSIMRPYLDEPLLCVLYPEPGKTSPINETAYTQPALFALEYALAELWQSWGIKPAAVMGHSVGEYVAATVAGVFSLEDGLKLIAARGRLMQALPSNGEMVALLASELQVAPVIQPYLQEVAIAALNGPESVVISGKRSTIRLVVAQLEAMGIKTTPLQVSHAFHSPLIEPMLEEFARVASEVTYSPPKINLISNVTGELAEAEVASPEYWCRHVRCSVRFAAGMEALYRAGYEVFVECGPKPILLGMGLKCLPEGVGRWLPSLRPGQEDWQQILQSLAQLYVEGVQADWSGFDQDYERRKVALPTYPFQRQRYWIETPQEPSIQNKQSQMQQPVNPLLGQTINLGIKGVQINGENLSALSAKPQVGISAETTRRDRIGSTVRSLFSDLLELSLKEVNVHTPFLEMGADSIILVNAVRSLEKTYGIKIAIRQFFEEFTTIDALTNYIDQNLDKSWHDLEAPQPEVQSQQPEQPTATVPSTQPIIHAETANRGTAPGTGVEEIMRQQLQVLSQIMSQQLEVLRGTTLPQEPSLGATTQPTASTVHFPNQSQQIAINKSVSSTTDEDSSRATPQAVSPVPSSRVEKPTARKFNLNQQQHIEALIARYTQRTQKSKQLAQAHRSVWADRRAFINFRREIKEMSYPIVGDRSVASRFWDVDGNEYVDLAMGFGVHLFGYNPPFIAAAVQEQIAQGLHIGPQSKIAGEVAQLICELTGVERVTFSNTGTEAVMTAVRLARATTGRAKIAIFRSSYHGHFDGVLAVADSAENGKRRSVPMAPGVPQSMVDDVLVLTYDAPQSLEFLTAHADELAAVLVEPVPTRQPNLQPLAFLQQLRHLTKEAGIALIFDECVTGFRLHPGGAQAWFGIEADIVIYGKLVGGGMPIGIIAGKSIYMDKIDGGLWRYEDDSYPEVETTFFAGTFCKHPLAMAAARAVLKHLKMHGSALQEQVNQRTSRLAETLNAYFEEEGLPIQVWYCGSVFRFASSGNFSYLYQPLEMDLLVHHLIEKGVYIWEGRSCFLSTAHSEEDIACVIKAVKDSVEELQKGGFFAKRPFELSEGEKVSGGSSIISPDPLLQQSQQLPLDLMLTPKKICERLKPELAQLMSQQGLDVYGELLTKLEVLSITYVQRAFVQMGWNFHLGQRFSTALIAEQLGVVNQYQQLLNHLLDMLAEAGVLRQVDALWEVIKVPLSTDLQEPEIALLAQQYPAAKAELTMFGRCGQSLAQVLRGECHALEVLFPSGDLTTATQIYQDSPSAVVTNTLVQKVVLKALERLPKGLGVRILEIGAGTGGTTSYIVPHLSAETEYVFTDVSPSLISKAKKKFGDRPNVRYQILDIEQEPSIQGFDSHHYDVIVAANVLHATRNIRQTIEHVQQLLAPGGMLVLLETTVRQRWLDLTFGLTEGWWKFADRDLRPSSPLLSTAQWQKLLSESGFREVALIPSQEQLSVLSQQAVIVAELARKVSLNEAQKQLGILAQISEDGSVAYNVSISLELKGSFQLAAMCKALQTVVNRHEALRTIISSQNDFQEILPSLTADVTLVDFSNGGDACGGLRLRECELQVADWLKKESQEPFDLSNGSLFRFSILKLEEKLHLLVLTIHHIVVDGWSVGVILQELGALYSAECQGVVCRLEPPMQFENYIEWQEKQSQTDAMAAHESYWLEQFAESIPVLDLPTDRPHPRLKTYKGSRQTRRLDVSLTREVKRFSTENGCTLLMTLLSVYTTLLHRLTGQNDIIVGMPTAGRSLEGSEKLVGYCAHILPVRSCLVGSESFLKYLKTLKNRLLEIYEHQDYPFARLIDKLNVARDASRSPLVTANFNWDRQVAVPKMFELATDLFPIPISCTSFDISLNVMEVDGKLVLDCNYNTDLFNASTIERWLGHFQTLLEGVVANPQQCIAELPLLSEAERHQLLVEWNNTQTEYPQNKCIHQLFEAQVERSPNAIAVVFEDKQLTYRELNQRANRIAHYLKTLGVGPEVLVGICVERSLEMIVGLLGILKAGGAYVPLDPTYPTDRLHYMLEDAGVQVLLTQARLVSSLPKHNAHVVCLDTSDRAIALLSESNPISGVVSSNLAYVIYTSGSTGLPKGVLVNHSNIVRLFEATNDWFHFDSRDVWTLFHSYAFDFSVWELWGALIYGGRLVVVPYVISREPNSFYKLLCQEKVTILNQTPSAFRQLIKAEESKGIAPDLDLRLVIFGGEALEPKSLKPWFERHGDRTPQLVNMYGITETTVHVTYCPLTITDINAKASGIGRTIPDLQVYLLDQHQQLVPIGVPGEMYIGGAGVARGYLNRPELTAQRFISNPFSDNPEALLYKSGDLARYLPNGDLEYLGRIDQQVKIRGFRIELGEIETAIAQHPAVRESVVLVREDEPGDKRLVAYVVPNAERSLKAGELRSFLKEKLPEYMVPVAFVQMSALPVTANGKVDRRALPTPDTTRPELEQAYQAPITPNQKLLADIWAQVLGLEQVGIHDNFFALGGDSIRSIQVQSLAQKHGLSFSVQQMFQHQTIHELAQELKPTEASTALAKSVQPFSLICEADRQRLADDVEDAYPVTALQMGMFFHSEFSLDSAVYHNITSLHIKASFDQEKLQATVQQLAARHPVLRTSFELSNFSKPLQLVHQAVHVPLQVEDLRPLSPAEQEEALAAWFEAEKSRKFDWRHAPLLRFQIHRCSEETFQFSFTEHHAILDGWSVASMVTELLGRYLSLLGEQVDSILPPISIGFRDFVALEQQAIASEECQRYWMEKLNDRTFTKLPRWSFIPKETNVRQVDVQDVPLSPEICEGLKQLALSAQVPLKSVLLAAHLRVLSLLGGQSEVLTGLSTNGRPEQTDGERVLGLFLNNLPFSLQLSGGTWVDLVRSVFEAERELLPYRRYPLAEIQRNLGGQPLSETAFNFVHFHVYQRVLGLKNLQLLGEKSFGENNFTFLALFSLKPNSSQIELSFEYDASELCSQQINRISGYYVKALAAMASKPQGRYELHSLLSFEEQHQLLIEWNSTEVDYPKDLCIHELFEAQVEQTPDAIAVVFEGEQLTYLQLNQRANCLAHHLKTLGVEPEVLVGICVERSLEMIVSLLGILKAGGAYLPLDPALPKESLAFRLQDAQVPILLTQKGLLKREEAQVQTVLYLDADWELIAQQSEANPNSEVIPENLAYVLYTSGSTGQPKGVAIEHRQILNYLHAILDKLQLPTGASFANVSTFAADLGNTVIFPALCTGGCLHIISQERATDPKALVEYFQRHPIDCLKIVPTHLASLLTSKASASIIARQCLVLGGEAASWVEIEKIQQEAPNCRILNHYGPTETTVGVLTYSVSSKQASYNSKTVPIGRPIANTQVYILDRHQQPVPIGVPGELHIGGASLARGYLNRPDLTTEKFINPFSGKINTRLYKTGDLVRYLSDGNIEFLGRLDRQVKIRGFRIELSEVETALAQHPAVRETLVVAREDIPGHKYLAAYIVCNKKEALTSSTLRDFLKEKLPSYMVPGAFVMLNALPLTPNGKVDRQALPTPDTASQELETTFVAARTWQEELLARIWREVLHRQQVSIHDNFFELGGDSILSILIIAKAKLAGFQLTPKQIFQHQTIAELAAVGSTTGTRKAEQGLVTGSLPLTPIQHWFFAKELPEVHHYNQAFLFFVPPTFNPTLLQQALQQLLVHHDALRLRFTKSEEGWQQFNALPDEAIPFSLVDLSALPETEQTEALVATSAQLQASLNLHSGPLVRVALFHLGDYKPSRLLLVIHHLAVDGVSWRILLEDLQTAYQQLEGGCSIQLPAKTTSFKHWAFKLTEYVRSSVARKELIYWQSLSRTQITRLPLDYSEGANTEASARTVSVSLNVEETRALLQEVPKAYRTQINDVLLSALVQVLAAWSRSNSVLVELEGHGREEILSDVDLSRTVGWFTTRFPMLLQQKATDNLGDIIKSIKEQLDAVPNRGIGYGLLRYLSGDAEITSILQALPMAEVSFNYLGQFDWGMQAGSLFKLAPESVGPEGSNLGYRSHLLGINLIIVEGQLQLGWTYSENFHSSTTIESLAQDYASALRSLIAHCLSLSARGYTPDVSENPTIHSEAQYINSRQREEDNATVPLHLLELPEDISKLLPDDADAAYPIAKMQEFMLHHYKNDPQKMGVYHGQKSYDIYDESLDLNAFKKALEILVQKHPALRTVFITRNGTPVVQVVKKSLTFSISEQDISHIKSDEQENYIDMVMKQDRQNLFNIENPNEPLFRFEIFWKAKNRFEFLMSVHHAIADGWGSSEFLNQLYELYSAFKKGEEITVAPSTNVYKEFVALEKEIIGSQDAVNFWRLQLKNHVYKPLKPCQASVNEGEAVASEHILNSEIISDLRKLCSQLKVSPKAIFLSTYLDIIGTLMKEKTLCVGIVSNGRTERLSDPFGALGLFWNMVPFCQSISSDKGVQIKNVQQSLIDIEPYVRYPLLQILADQQKTELFFATFNFVHFHNAKNSLAHTGLKVHGRRFHDKFNFPLNYAVSMSPFEGNATLYVEYDKTYFSRQEICSMIQNYIEMLKERIEES